MPSVVCTIEFLSFSSSARNRIALAMTARETAAAGKARQRSATVLFNNITRQLAGEHHPRAEVDASDRESHSSRERVPGREKGSRASFHSSKFRELCQHEGLLKRLADVERFQA